MDATFGQWVLGQVGLGGVAALSMFLLNKAHLDARQREREVAEMLRADRAELLSALKDVTRAVATLESTIAELIHERTRRPAKAD